MTTRPSKLAYQKKAFKKSYVRFKTIATMKPEEQRRLDIALVTTDVPLRILSKRFGINVDMMHKRLEEVFGLKVLRECKETETQERIEISKEQGNLFEAS